MAALQTTSTPIGAQLNKPPSHWEGSNGQGRVVLKAEEKAVSQINVDYPV